MLVAFRDYLLKHRTIAQSLISVLLLVIVVWRSNPSELFSAIQEAPLLYFIPWMFFYFTLVTLTWGIGIYFMLRRVSSCGMGQIINASFKLQVLATITPGRLGDLGLLYFLKNRYTLGQITAVAFVDKLITLFVNVVLVIIALGVFFSWKYSLIFTLAVSLAAIVLLWFAFRCPRNIFQWGWLELLLNKLKGFRVELSATCLDLTGIFVNLFLTVFRYLFAGVSLLLAINWLGGGVSFVNVVLIQSLSQFAAFLPLTIMGIGIQEGVCVYLFELVSIEPEIVLATFVLGRGLHLFIIVTIYLLILILDFRNKETGESLC